MPRRHLPILLENENPSTLMLSARPQWITSLSTVSLLQRRSRHLDIHHVSYFASGFSKTRVAMIEGGHRNRPALPSFRPLVPRKRPLRTPISPLKNAHTLASFKCRCVGVDISYLPLSSSRLIIMLLMSIVVARNSTFYLFTNHDDLQYRIVLALTVRPQSQYGMNREQYCRAAVYSSGHSAHYSSAKSALFAGIMCFFEHSSSRLVILFQRLIDCTLKGQLLLTLWFVLSKRYFGICLIDKFVVNDTLFLLRTDYQTLGYHLI